MEQVPLPVWPVVRIIILQIPPSRLFLFPFIAGTVWFLTLSALLLTWLGRGSPRYPGQGNPYVAFISDIASFELKPLFLVGASITAVSFVVSVAAVHVVRYEYFPPIYPPGNSSSLWRNNNNCHSPNDSRTHEEEDESVLATTNMTKSRAAISLVSIVAAIVAAMGLVLLGVMDTFRYHQAHSILLKICFAGLALTAAGTVVVYAEEVVSFLARWEGDEEDKQTRRWLRFCTLASASLVILEFCLGITFIILSAQECWHVAGIFEWIMAFLGTAYMGLFAGFFVGIQEETRKHRVRYPRPGEGRDHNGEDMDERERRPLLSDGRREYNTCSATP
ncbi:hypothetical protein AOR_1_1722194 [Paecilomyces variotii No. 5]|uniref:CWH43-like N-terminal domain-containing protein n=1 Tax=Byssochlamys spectabilis (strain No. 5 / NBRC 109023) TaxID=1356009 RepID=V5GA53_BYSSN|nr:hypothetical protein AOR_1_1722194 [Paecilomyces variotii No. 5]